MKRFVLTAALGVVIVSGAALAQGLKPDDIIAARQSAFDLQGGVAAAMKGVVDAGGDVKPLVAGAKGMVAWGKVIPTMFPDDTKTGHNTKAKPEIWTDKAGFDKAAAGFVAAAEKLVVAAESGDKDAFKTQFAALGAGCGSCHRPYRAQ